MTDASGRTQLKYFPSLEPHFLWNSHVLRSPAIVAFLSPMISLWYLVISSLTINKDGVKIAGCYHSWLQPYLTSFNPEFQQQLTYFAIYACTTWLNFKINRCNRLSVASLFLVIYLIRSYKWFLAGIVLRPCCFAVETLSSALIN